MGILIVEDKLFPENKKRVDCQDSAIFFGAYMLYRIGREPKMTALHNIKTWQKLKLNLESTGSVRFEQLVEWCKDHEHVAGGRGFIHYCIRNKWLVQAGKE